VVDVTAGWMLRGGFGAIRRQNALELASPEIGEESCRKGPVLLLALREIQAFERRRLPIGLAPPNLFDEDVDIVLPGIFENVQQTPPGGSGAICRRRSPA
jgi:hypothetical protein